MVRFVRFGWYTAKGGAKTRNEPQLLLSPALTSITADDNKLWNGQQNLQWLRSQMFFNFSKDSDHHHNPNTSLEGPDEMDLEILLKRIIHFSQCHQVWVQREKTLNLPLALSWHNGKSRDSSEICFNQFAIKAKLWCIQSTKMFWKFVKIFSINFVQWTNICIWRQHTTPEIPSLFIAKHSLNGFILKWETLIWYLYISYWICNNIKINKHLYFYHYYSFLLNT